MQREGDSQLQQVPEISFADSHMLPPYWIHGSAIPHHRWL